MRRTGNFHVGAGVYDTTAEVEIPVQIENIWKTYGRTTAVRDLSLTVPSGSVYGFLGPNGAGKSTTLRIVLGLQRADRGKIFLFGRPLESNRAAILRRTGSLIESPSLYLHLTGRENLEVHRRLLGCGQRAIDQALETVRLLPFGDRLVRNYSSGMKQRLGLAQALLANPDVLLLDEPTNGLDPAGIHEVRSLVRELPKQSGVTVFLSSHLLAEVEQVATHLAIISQGELKFEGTPEQLQRRSGSVIALDVDRVEYAEALLMEKGCTVRRQGDRLLVSTAGRWEAAEVNSMLVHAGISVSHLSAERPTLEELFLELTGTPTLEEELAKR